MLRRGQPRRQQPIRRAHRVHSRRTHRPVPAVVQKKISPAPTPPVARNSRLQIRQIPSTPIGFQSYPVTFHITGVSPSSRAARSTAGLRAPYGGRKNFTAAPVISSSTALHSASSCRTRAALAVTAADGSSCGCPRRAPPPPLAAQAPALRAQISHGKKCRANPCRANTSSNCGAAASFGRSSNVSATSSASYPQPESARRSAT